jgi:hypothetical protein
VRGRGRKDVKKVMGRGMLSFLTLMKYKLGAEE